MRWNVALACVVSASLAGCAEEPIQPLPAAVRAIGADTINSITYAGTGRWFQFGQAPAPTQPWPQFDVSRFEATIDYAAPAARVEIARLQTIDPGRQRPAPVEQRVTQLVSGAYAWNMAVPAGQPGGAPAPVPQTVAVEERVAEIWTTPHGFLRAASANNAMVEPSPDGSAQVTFTMDGHRYAGTLNAQHQLERVQSWIDNPVLGDTPIEIAYADYKDFGGVTFPAKVTRTQGGHPVLDLTVTSVTANPGGDFSVPEAVRSFTPPPVTVEVEKLADGVFYLKGGSHHSVAIAQRDHVVVVEGPQHEERSMAVIAKVKETIPDKPIRYVVNTHHHFDHSGGLRTYVDEGATIVTHQAHRPFYEQAWAAPRTLKRDRLAASGKAPVFETFDGKHVLTDGRRTIEIHEIEGSGHSDGFAMVYLPAERLVIQADAFTPGPAAAPPPATPNPYTANLYENIERLKLNVRTVVPLHGPRLVPLAELQTAARPAGRTD